MSQDWTGLLLVGGASERFGSPKALAPFRGETLAARGWRVLHEVCDEVLAVGKAADIPALPFPVLDDGAAEHAPVHGLVAGLRVASHDLCIALPVDCPLVTPGLLRELGEARAVPPTGPLPGAYARGQLPELERRVASGELSLRGVNENVIAVDERLLANVNTRMDLIEAAIADWAAEREDVRAAVVVGSRARRETPADRWSDIDVLLVVDDPDPYLADSAWVSEFGEPVLTFLEAAPVGAHERRVLYGSGADVDLLPVTLAGIELFEQSPDAARVIARGFRVLVDGIGLEKRLERVAGGAGPPELPTKDDLRELASDVWYHLLWAARKLRRGEVFTAKECLDGYVKARLATLLAWHARAVDPSVDTWHGGRFLERWADPGALAALEQAYARYDVRDVARALWATIDLWQGLEEETAGRLGIELGLDHAGLRERIAAVVPDPRRGSTL